ncbi:MFS transporter [Nocardiopsis trehalosi]|uniref:MFS transporter n=1 Tax=Nocardiopsis trehalosi TaxID=109329 RepID=UPI00082BB92D|nr:MFS transporter [Nocardiopsis trehalosi]
MTTPSAPVRPSAPPSPLRSRWTALVAVASASLMLILDGSIVTVALPAVQHDLGFTPAGTSWVVNAYLIAFGSLLLLAGRLGDLLGRTRLFLAGLAVFTAASLLAGAAGSAAVLIAARFLQGVGAAMSAAVGLGILVTLFTAPRERATALAVLGFTGAAGASIGQVAGGVLTDALSWHWIFLINLPIGLLVLALALPSLPRDRGPGLSGGADLLGAALATGGLVLAILAVVGVAEHGWTGAPTLAAGAGGAVLLTGFGVRQATARTPLVPPRVLRSRAAAGANAVQLLMVAALYAFQIVLALYLQNVLGYGAGGSGLAMLPAALAIGATSLGLSARLIGRFGERAVLLTGLVLLAVLLTLLARLPADADFATGVLPLLPLSAGFGLALPALTGLAMSGAGPDDAGTASGVFTTTQQVGSALGAAALTTLAATRTETLLAAGAERAAALAEGYTLAFGAGAVLITAAIAVALTLPTAPRAPRS